MKQKGYIEKQLTTTPFISAYSCKITAQGIDIIETHKFLIFLKIIKKFWWVIAVLIPVIVYYVDLFGLKTRFFTTEFKTPSINEQFVASQPTQKIQDLEEAKQKIAKIKINRIIEDAAFWLEERIKQNMSEIEKIKYDFASRNASYGGGHVTAHINRVNYFIKSVNDYIREMNRKIEDILLGMGQEKFEAVAWLGEEHKKYTDFLEKVQAAKNSIRQQNDGVCLKFTDKPTYDNILKANPYIK